MSNITISSLNVRGLGNNEKRREIFQWLRKKKFSIYMLQEVHCTERSFETWAAEWGYTAFFSGFASNKAGVAILFNNNFAFKVLRQICDKEGRYIIIDLEVGEQILTICNIYAPNKDDPFFFQNIREQMTMFRCEEIILGGDFNLVMDVKKDKKGGKSTTHRNAWKVIQNIRDILDLTDIWRDLNPDGRRYTWRQNKPEIHCRLDFFLVSVSLAGRILKADILPGYKTDHSLCNIVINYQTHPRGPGLWKLNSSLLEEMDYVNKIKSTILETVNQYESDETVDEVLLWEMIKLQIRDTSIKYSKAKIKKMKTKEADIENDISALERQLESCINNNKEALAEQLRVKKRELENIIEYKTKGAIIRSKVRWYNEGEKNNKYFLNLENRHCKKKTIMQIKAKDGANLTNDSDILRECNSFYSDLYATKSTKITEDLEKNFIGYEHPHKLNEIDKEKCEGPLSERECFEAVKSMESGKSPGTDGLPAEFYKVFWKDVSTFLISALNKSYQKGNLAITQRRGIISLIPKKDKALNELKNWRPITLLNCDYKIASKAIASRLKSVLPDLIDHDQTGFMKGRSIAENICLINNVISYTHLKDIPGLLLFIDFEKAFDTIEWTFVRKALEHFGFGFSLINWINLFYSDIQSCIINNGWSGGFFHLGRGVRQGCPLSPYLFILCAEVLATAIRGDNEIKGISVGNVECKLSQYADDIGCKSFTAAVAGASDNFAERAWL